MIFESGIGKREWNLTEVKMYIKRVKREIKKYV